MKKFEALVTDHLLATEHQMVVKAVANAAEKTGLGWLPVEYAPRDKVGDFNISAVEMNGTGAYVAIAYTPGITRCFDQSDLDAVVMHEYGHIAQGHWRGSDLEMEQDADRFAAEHGYAEASAVALEKAMKFLAQYYAMIGQVGSHPEITERIKFFRGFQKTAKAGA